MYKQKFPWRPWVQSKISRESQCWWFSMLERQNSVLVTELLFGLSWNYNVCTSCESLGVLATTVPTFVCSDPSLIFCSNFHSLCSSQVLSEVILGSQQQSPELYCTSLVLFTFWVLIMGKYSLKPSCCRYCFSNITA